jgi:phosphopantothenoylcysteine decarboxylase / phosphopantothenate---cysteine ligase
MALAQIDDSFPLAGRRILLGLTGGIACYKAAVLCRLLAQAGATVQVAMTQGAQHFITTTTMQGLSGQPVWTSQWDDREAVGVANAMPHIQLGRWADAIVVAPATADFMARLAQGRADDLLSLTCLARPTHTAPLLIAPAMNREMWAHPATQRNVVQLAHDGATVLDVAQGEQACGEVGDGRMLEPEAIVAELTRALTPPVLQGQHVLVSAGPTFEAIDPVRGMTNLSSGKMGFAIAKAAREAGARVSLVAGPTALPTPFGVHCTHVQSALQMKDAIESLVGDADVFISTAAVADWRPVNAATEKMKKDGTGQPPVIQFCENPDILAGIAKSARAQSGHLFCVGFAAESHDLLAHAQAKRLRKQVPLLVGNIGPQTFGQDHNALLLVDEFGVLELPKASKISLARALVRQIALRWSPPTSAAVQPL